MEHVAKVSVKTKSNWLLRFLRKWMDRIFAVIGVFIFLQAPLFIQQYTYRLSGHVAELKIQIDILQQAALISNKTLDAYIKKFITSGDVDFSGQGRIMQQMLERYERLNLTLETLQTASPLKRPFVFLSSFNYEISRSTMEGFQPGISLTLEALVYGIGGLLFGYGLFAILGLLFRGLEKLR